ncbi:MAG: hypothetical protein F6J90_04740 [Moorea sp. SIOASIH]|uniref:hypothetical protein n=1 Tax=Moorena sp. SIOASIH TaxID=2607817 RepID=UPI0013BB030A|nr:hypothetical protein [Moorena sp. SIOASIH]NEO35663.1 hypothetical protein [Moorena sp. SIOASIH]
MGSAYLPDGKPINHPSCTAHPTGIILPISPSPHLPISPHSLFPIPYSLFPTPYSLLPKTIKLN